jgi:hypothetical protein
MNRAKWTYSDPERYGYGPTGEEETRAYVRSGLERNRIAEENAESQLAYARERRMELLQESRDVMPMHEAAAAAGITRESAWRLIRVE